MKNDRLHRFDLWLAIKYFSVDKLYIERLYKSKDVSYGYNLAMVLVSEWLNQFSNFEKLESAEVLEKRWNRMLKKMGKKSGSKK